MQPENNNTNVKSYAEELSLSINLYKQILKKHELNQLINNVSSNSIELNHIFSVVIEYFNIFCQFLEEFIILNQKLYYDYINNLFNSS